MVAVPPEDYHVTLVYYGGVTPWGTDRLERAIAAIAARHPPFTLSLDGTGRFRDGAVLWAGIAGDVDALTALRQGLLPATEGFGSTSRRAAGTGMPPFLPHVTLARSRAGGRARLGAIGSAGGRGGADRRADRFGIPTIGPAGPDRWTVDRITLFETVEHRYEVLAQLPLGPGGDRSG